MKKINSAVLKRLIKQEVKKLVDEDALFPLPAIGEPHYVVANDEETQDEPEEDNVHQHCDACGSHHQDNSCPASKMDDYVDALNEACGCQSTDSQEDYSLATMPVNDNHKSGAYMAKSQLFKLAKYAQQLYAMLPEDYDLEDWMLSHISEASDDLSEVYHSLDHKVFKGEI